MQRLILASQSPRRKDLLTNMGFDFDIVVSDVEEKVTKTDPNEIVVELSKLKAHDVYDKVKPADGTLILAADTLVFLKNERLGKPADDKDAFRMLRELSGREHHVITGVTLIYQTNGKAEEYSFSEDTSVLFAELSDKEILDYIATGEPKDKAGSYAIQGKGAKFVKGINGDYSNVVGLPVPRLYEEMKAHGII